MKWARVSDAVWLEFLKNRATGGEIHDRDIAEWGLEAAESVDLPDFKVDFILA